MFDLSRLTELVSDLVGQDAVNSIAGNVFEQLSQNGIDMSQLQGLAPEEIVTTLSEQGIDLSSFAPDQIAQLGEQIGVELPFGDVLSQLGGGQAEQ